MSLLCPAAKVLEELILPSINKFISPAKDQHGFRPRHSTTSAFLQFTTNIETGCNHRKPPHYTVCVVMDLTAAFDTVSHDKLISKIAGLSLPPAITRWLSCYLRGRQAATSFRGIKSRIVRTGVPQGSKQTGQNAALRTATGALKMASIEHLHQESLTLKSMTTPICSLCSTL